MENKKLLLLLLVLGTAFWGISFPVTKMAIGGYSHSLFLLYRFALAAVLMALFFAKRLANTNCAAILTGIGLAIPLTLCIYFQTLGLQHTSAAQCGFVAGMFVVFTPLVKVVFYRIAVAKQVWLAALVALAGLAVISLKGNLRISIGDAYTLLGAFWLGFYLINVEKHSKKGDIVLTLVPMFTTCALLMLAASLAGGTADWTPLSSSFWVGVAFCALFSTAYMYAVSNLAQKFISAEKVAIIYLFEPVFAALASFLLLSEDLTWRLLLGGSLIVLATLISEVKFAKRPRALSS